MKIRHKQSGVVIDGEFTALGEGNAFGSREYYVPVEALTCSRYDTSEWEEVKPVWKDVTMECSSLPHLASLRHEGDVIAELKSGYRLRKVCPDSQYPAECFIIEQRQA